MLSVVLVQHLAGVEAGMLPGVHHRGRRLVHLGDSRARRGLQLAPRCALSQYGDRRET
jgi:hypothetical protein